MKVPADGARRRYRKVSADAADGVRRRCKKNSLSIYPVYVTGKKTAVLMATNEGRQKS